MLAVCNGKHRHRDHRAAIRPQWLTAGLLSNGPAAHP
jgi:hypothetical protein